MWLSAGLSGLRAVRRSWNPLIRTDCSNNFVWGTECFSFIEGFKTVQQHNRNHRQAVTHSLTPTRRTGNVNNNLKQAVLRPEGRMATEI